MSYQKDFEIKKIHMGEAKVSLDLGDGSERGEYVDQDYILQTLGRPHRAISLMYCYYPNDEGWPGRASVAFADKEVSFAWDYPYDDYFTYKGGIDGDLSDEPFKYMREVRKHGMDVLLTLTMDPKCSDEQIAAVARDLRTFGRVMLRINHEATGDWFSFNKRADYPEVAAFFVKCCDIFHREAPNVKIVLCLDGCTSPDDEKMKMEDIFTEAARAADIVSVDRYLALHWGWPYDVAGDPGVDSFKRDKVHDIYDMCKKSYGRYTFMNNGTRKPMVLSELNADGDVTGPYDQAEMVKEFCRLLKEDPDKWLSAFTMYQFRDRGRLGLEIEDPNNKNVGIKQPVLDAYKEILHDEYFSPEITDQEKVQLPVTLRWGGAEDAEGIGTSVSVERQPAFCELYFDEELESENLMIEFNDWWFYKAPGVKCIDMMTAFFEKPVKTPETLELKIFAPPATGENDPSQGENWQTDYYHELKKMPRLRISYDPVIK